MKKNIAKLSLILLTVIFLGASCGLGPQTNNKQTSGPTGMFVTTDDGETWSQISNLMTVDGVENIENAGVYRVFKDPQDPNALYWASRGSGLYYSYNKGQAWQKAEVSFEGGFVYNVAIHPEDKCTIFATDGMNVYRSNDCSRSWEQVHKEDRQKARINTLAFQKSEPYKLFLGKKNGDLLATPNFGASWNVINRFDSSISEIYTDKQHPKSVFIASQQKGLYRSQDLGENWVSLKKTMEDYTQALDFHRAVVYPGSSNKIFWASKYGLLVSEDRGDSWEPIELVTSPGSADIWGLAVNPKDDSNIYYTATVQNRSTFYFSKDGGQSWSTQELPTGQLPVSLKVHNEDPSIIYAGFMNPTKDT